MIGSKLKELLDERGIKVSAFAREAGVGVQTLNSIINRDSRKVDLETLLKICIGLDVPLEVFYKDKFPQMVAAPLPDGKELELLSRIRRLDEHGRKIIGLVLDEELERVEAEELAAAQAAKIAELKVIEERETRTIPLYRTPAAAGYASPAFGDDYEDYEVPATSQADFAARISGDSMEPYIEDGSIVLVTRGAELIDGDVGLFFVDGDMKCKQYCEDNFGNIYLLSLNRERKDSDVVIRASGNLTVCCIGKVLMHRRPPLPKD